jgi:hypothetical protein
MCFSLLFTILFCCSINAQETTKSELQQKAEAADQNKNVPQARSFYIHAFNDYTNKGQTSLGVECATKATALYYKENLYKEVLRTAASCRSGDFDRQAAWLTTRKPDCSYLVTKERMQMYLKLKKGENTKEQINKMEILATRSADEAIRNDLLYSKAIYYYTFGMNAPRQCRL